MATRSCKITDVAHKTFLLDVTAGEVKNPELGSPGPAKLYTALDHKGAVLQRPAGAGRTFVGKQAGSPHFLMLSFKGSFKLLFLKFKWFVRTMLPLS